MPPLQFRRRPPQSNCPPDNVLCPDYGAKLDFQINKGGISTLAPPRLAPQLQSLPPILHISTQKSMSSYSKGARGLSVQLRETGIFTGTTNSLSLSLRQRPTRYAIHAGRNFNYFTYFYVDQTIPFTCQVPLGGHFCYASVYRTDSFDMLYQ